MKRCPTCSRVYDDVSLRFCLDDGTVLVNKLVAAASPTLVLPAHDQQPTLKQDFSPEVAPVQAHSAGSTGVHKRNLLPWLLGFVVLLLFSAGVFGVLVIRQKRALTWHLLMEIDPSIPDREAAAGQTVDVVKKRLDAYGIGNFQVVPQGGGRILVSLPTVKDPERLKSIITTGGKLELLAVISPPSPGPVQTYSTKDEALASLQGFVPDRRVLPYIEREEPSNSPRSPKWVVVEWPSIVNGSELRDASAARTASGGEDYEIDFWLNKTGADRFSKWTGANINQYIGVALNDEVKSIAYIKSQISDQGVISGRFTKQAAEDLALVLKSGALPAPIKIVEERTDKS